MKIFYKIEKKEKKKIILFLVGNLILFLVNHVQRL